MKCAVSIDWLTFTVKGMSWNDVVETFLGLNTNLFTDLSITMNGYQHVMAFSNIYVCYQPRENQYFKNMGVCVSMSGSGCRTFENFSSFAGTDDKEPDNSRAFITLFSKINDSPDVKISRLDVACDDKEGYLDMETIVGCVNDGELRTRLLKRTIYTKGTVKNIPVRLSILVLPRRLSVFVFMIKHWSKRQRGIGFVSKWCFAAGMPMVSCLKCFRTREKPSENWLRKC